MPNPPMSFINFDRKVSASDLWQILAKEESEVVLSRFEDLPHVLMVAHGGENFLIAVHWGALDRKIIEDDLAQKNAWSNWGLEVAAWTSYAVVSLQEPASKGELNQRTPKLLNFTSWLVSLCGAHSVGWSGSNLFKSAGDYLDLVNNSKPPVEILIRCVWTSDIIKPGKQMLGAMTRGLEVFGFDEIEHLPVSGDFFLLYDRLMNLATYLISSAISFKDGDTVSFEDGVTASLRLRSDPQRMCLLFETKN